MTFPTTTLDTAAQAPDQTSLTHWWHAVKRELRYLEEGLTYPDEDNREVLSTFAYGMSRLLQPRSIWAAATNGWTAVANSGPIRKAREIWNNPTVQAGASVVLTIVFALASEGFDDGWMDMLPFSFEADDAQDLSADELLAGGLCQVMEGRGRAADAEGVKTNTQGP